MMIRPRKLIIADESPFADDRLQRRESADRLSHLLERVNPPFVLAIDAKYGNGKTTFIHMWKAHLTAQKFNALYFNAWEADFASDPLIAFIGEMDSEIERLVGKSKNATKLQKSWKQVKKVGAYLARRAIPVGVKVGTAGYLDSDKFTEQSIAVLAEGIAKEQIEKYEGTKTKIKEFKAHLSEFIKGLRHPDDGPQLPLVFFVDELDRCRPPYAIELLERIKHFFGIEEIVFVLAVDKVQLSSSIRAIYGNGIDVHGYLRRFIDLEYCLPIRDSENFVSSLVERTKIVELMAKGGVQEARRIAEIGANIFSGLATAFELSLRVQEQCFGALAVILLTADMRQIHLPLLFALLALKAADDTLYNDFVSHRKGVNAVLSYITETQNGRSFMEESNGILVEALLLKSRLEDPATIKTVDGYKAMQRSVEPGRQPQADELRARDILVRVESGMYNYDMVKDAARAIAFADQFRPQSLTSPA